MCLGISPNLPVRFRLIPHCNDVTADHLSCIRRASHVHPLDPNHAISVGVDTYELRCNLWGQCMV